MRCKKCGAENPEDSRFCGNCGAQFETEETDSLREKPVQAKRQGRKWIWGILAVVVIAGIIAGVLILRNVQERKSYEKYLDSAEKYLEELDYENAEAAYLKAIDVEPKEEEPYVALARLYLGQGETDKAQTILEQGAQKTSGTVKSGTHKEEEESIEDLLEDVKDAAAYTWVLDPSVQADDIISLEELKTALGKNLEKEIKSTKDLKGTFIEILRKDNFRKILQIIQDKGWHIHFCIVQVFYYGFVDIIDSISGLECAPFAFKAELYKVLKRNPNTTISIFKKYKYPNVGTKYIKDFLSELIILIDGVIVEDAKKYRLNPLLVFLKNSLEKAKEQKELVFIQNETTHEWVGNFVQFYRQQILSFPKKTLVFDEEKQVMSQIAEEDIIIDGKAPDNYSFKESGTDAMIQVCDYVVSILRKYMIFLDRLEPEVDADIQKFDENQMNNYKLLNRILADSLNYNPLFVHFVACQHTVAKYHKYIQEYGGPIANE